MNVKQLAILALVATGAAAAGSAHARDNVQWSVTLASPFGLPLPPVPVITMQRAPVVVAAPAPVYAPAYGYSSPGYGYAPGYRAGYYAPPLPPPLPRYYGHQRGWRDADHDGIPNRYDHVYNPRWDRDGDGVPNRYDRQPDRPNRR